jgi:hypothetical protein
LTTQRLRGEILAIGVAARIGQEAVVHDASS